MLELPDIAGRLAASGAYAVGNSAQDMSSQFAAEKERWARLIRETGFRLPN